MNMLKKAIVNHVTANHVMATAMLVLSATTVTSAHAGAIDFRLGSHAAELSYLTQNASFGYGGADIGFGMLVNDNNDFIGNASILVSGTSAGDVKALHFGVGIKAYVGTVSDPVSNLNGGAVAIGARVRYVFPGSVPLAVLAEGYYAPDITSLSDFNGVQEYRVALEYEVTPSARAYIGYRRLQLKINNRPNYDIDNNPDIGIRFEF